MGLKLNLGCGQNPRDGYLNVDKYGSADLTCDLEAFPWPWPDNSVPRSNSSTCSNTLALRRIPSSAS